jgi:photosystem II stability/assembly factor-like uncharacterized protein
LKIFYKIILHFVFTVLFFSNYTTANWKKVNIPPEFESNDPFLEVMFLKSNPNVGWICGFEGRVLRTVDGGKTWTGTRITDGLQLESIHFLDSLNGYTSGSGKIFKSTDGGVRWLDVTDRRFPIDIWLWGNYFVTKDLGMVIGGGCEPENQYFYRTTNGGTTWSIYEKDEFNSGLTDLFLTSADGLGYAVSSGRLWRTMDGGLTWDVIAVTGDRDWQEDLAISGNTFLIPYSKGCSGGGYDGGLRISTDNGENWREFNTGQPMFGTFLLDEKCGWGVGWESNIYYTSDGGQSWTLRNNGIETGDDLDDICFINDTTGWLVGSHVYKTYNLDSIISVPEEITIPNKPAIVPNPLSDHAEICFSLEKDDFVELTLFSLTGEKLKPITKDYYTQGKHCVKFNNEFSSGMYFVVLRTGKGVSAEKLILIGK